MKCSACSFENAADARFCENCGQPFERKCPQCGTSNSASARFCKSCGAGLIVAPPIDPKQALAQQLMPQSLAAKLEASRPGAEGERRVVTILFCDVKGSTALAEKLDPEEWADIMNGAFEYLIAPVYRYEGLVARLMGDAILAFFGAPIAHEDDPQRAVLAGLGILEGIRAYREKIRRERGLEFDVRVGINTGLVVVGGVGSDLRMEYTAMGDAVNLAARMEQTAQPGTVQISGHTHRLVASLFEFEPLGNIEVKGKADPVPAYRVAGERKGAVRARGIAGLSSEMVGRQREYATLTQIAADAQAGRGSIVSIIGEAGLGKSRLVAEWRKGALAGSTDRPVRWIEGRCLSYAASTAHHLSTDVLRHLIELPAGASEEETHLALQKNVKALCGAQWSDVYPSLAHLLGLVLEDDIAARVKYLDGPALQHQYITAYKTLLIALARSAPTVVVCEDVHWADPSSVELGTHILPIAAEAPIVFVFVTRADKESAGWKLIAQAHEIAGVGATELYLAPLSESDSRQLMSNLLEIESLPDALRQMILSKAEGNPFFVEEVIRMLIDRGGIAQQDGQWIATREIESIDIPDTLQGILTARIDRLSDEAKRALQIASVIGRKFSVEILAEVMAQDRR